MRKVIWRGLPPPGRDHRQAEAHYVDVHVPMSRRFLLLDPAQVAYSTLRARRQLDTGGGFNDPPAAWRYIVFLEDPPSGVAAEPTDEQQRLRQLLTDDNPLVIGRSVRCRVEEEVLVDRRSGQTSFVKTLLEFDRRDDTTPADAESEVRRFASALAARAAGVRGARLVVANWPREQQQQTMRDDGRYDVTGWEADGPKVGYVELLFDNPLAATTLLGANQVIDALFGDGLTGVTGAAYLVDERCEFDRR